MPTVELIPDEKKRRLQHLVEHEIRQCGLVLVVGSAHPSIRIDARGVGAELRVQPVTESKMVKPVIEKFREKYGAGDVKKYYSKFDVAFVANLE